MSGLVEASRQVASEDASTFKIVIVEHGHDADTLVNLLTRNLRIPKKRITQLGHTASDEQNASLLRRRNPIVVAPRDILTYRPCLFYPPPGTTQVAVIAAIGDQVEVSHRSCSDEPFELREQ